MIDRAKWELGQIKERQHHILSLEDGAKHFGNTYYHYFKYLDIDQDLDEKSIIEVGSADFPALGYCYNHGECYVVEPMPSKILKGLCKDKGIKLIFKPAEEVDFKPVDEVWFMNVLQHVLDPDVIIEKAKEAADVIRFFEPIETAIDQCHHHSFTVQYFKDYFGGCVNRYEADQGIEGFHKWQNAFGVWTK